MCYWVWSELEGTSQAFIHPGAHKHCYNGKPDPPKKQKQSHFEPLSPTRESTAACASRRTFLLPSCCSCAARERELPSGWAASPPRAVTLCWRAPRTSIPAGWLLPLHREDGAAPSPPRLGYVRVVRATVHGSISYFPFCAECWIFSVW